jgi:hypothetical protein
MQITQVMAMCNITSPAQTAFFHAKKTICEEIRRLADNSCPSWRGTMRANSIPAMDGSWSQTRNPAHCIAAFVDVFPGKIVHFEILEREVGFSHGNYFGSSNGTSPKQLPAWPIGRSFPGWFHPDSVRRESPLISAVILETEPQFIAR